jgi:hypothetical protein
MLAYKITDEVRVKATKDQPKTITIIEGDALYRRSRANANKVEILPDERHVFDSSILLSSDGTTRIRLTVPLPKEEPKKPKKQSVKKQGRVKKAPGKLTRKKK